MSVPDQLIIVFKRFSGRFSKIDHVIKFGMDLSLEEYLHDSVQTNSQYEINAVSLHSGGCGGGHYTAYVKSEEGLCYNCNDSSVQQIAAIDGTDARAYVLSYSRK